MNLQSIFTDNPVCLLTEEPQKEVWRVINVSEGVLNYLRNWLERNLSTVAINWLEVDTNTSIHPNEVLAERMGLIPIVADPLSLDKYEGELGEVPCSEETCVLFELEANNPGPTSMNVLTRDLRWIPIGDQVERFAEPPHALYPDQVITILRPGDRLKLRAYAVRGEGKDNVKWSSTFVYHRLIPTGVRPFAPVRVEVYPELPPEIYNAACVPCEELPEYIRNLPGFRCFYFTVELTGGLSFNDIQRQLETRFEWDTVYPTEIPKYNLPEIY